MKFTAKDIESHLDQIDDNNFDMNYLRFHIDRYIYILEFIQKKLSFNEIGQDILDVGPSYQTELIRKYFPNLTIDTLGYNHRVNLLKGDEAHFHKDLNQTQEDPTPITQKKYDIVICSEVLEHIYTNPLHIIKYMSNMLKPKGILFIQTPNAVAIHKRFKMLLGKNPFQLLEDSRMGHFREYTGKEITDFYNKSGLNVTAISYKNYFGFNSNVLHLLFKKLNFFMPSSFRDGMTIIGNKR